MTATTGITPGKVIRELGEYAGRDVARPAIERAIEVFRCARLIDKDSAAHHARLLLIETLGAWSPGAKAS